MKFDPIVPNPDIDVHPDPPGLWQHVAVICRWKDAKAQRKQWPHAAVIGPLRTVRGLDELARNLLNNPQIRVVLVVGNDLTEGEETTQALIDLWRGKPEGEKHIGEEVRGPFWDVQTLVTLVPDHMAGWADDVRLQWLSLAKFADSPPPWTHETKPPDYNPPCGHFHGRYACTDEWCGYGADTIDAGSTSAARLVAAARKMYGTMTPSPLAALVPSDMVSERPKVTLPPPPPKATAPAPAGDPGERVVGETLADLWPQVLHRAMRFGREAPTQHGPTRELLCLVAVVRDVERSVRDFYPRWVCEPHGWSEVARPGDMHGSCPQCGGYLLHDEARHPVLQITRAQAEAYHRRITQAAVPEGAPYSYGSRMRGVGLPHKRFRVGVGRGRTVDADGRVVYETDYKVLYDEDCCEKEPSCLRSRGHEGHCDREEWHENEKNLKVLAEEHDQIAKLDRLLAEKPDTRAAYVTPWRPAEDSGKESGRPCMVGAWWRVEGQRLHLVVAFRSHDLAAAYPTNLAGLLLWQADTAARLGMRPGTLTVTSYSAHVYERDWNGAEVVIKEHYEKARREPAWDQRSSWHVELVPPVIIEKPVEVGEVLQVPRSASGALDPWEVQAEPLLELYDHVWIENQTTGERRQVSLHDWRTKRGDYRGAQPKPTLRATALTPDGREVLGTFEAETPEALRAMCERSGLVTSIGAALWLGDEIRKVAGRQG